MQIKETQLINGCEVDSFKGKININRYRITLKYDKNSKKFQVVKVAFPTEKNPKYEFETLYESRILSYAIRNYNEIANERDILIPD
jgi:hypothetical protein